MATVLGEEFLTLRKKVLGIFLRMIMLLRSGEPLMVNSRGEGMILAILTKTYQWC